MCADTTQRTHSTAQLRTDTHTESESKHLNLLLIDPECKESQYLTSSS